MGVRICFKNGRCLTCSETDMATVTEVVLSGRENWCCQDKVPAPSGSGDTVLRVRCMKVSEIVSWEETRETSEEDRERVKQLMARYV